MKQGFSGKILQLQNKQINSVKNMKLINYIMASVLFLSATLLGSCSEEENTLSKAVLASASALDFEAEGAQPKTITVYADADWVMEDLPEWITVTPATGNGTTDVTVSVTDNMRDGAEDNPRKATIVFKGCTLASRAEVVVSQDGDKYRDCQEYTVDELPALEDETVVSVPEALVTAVTTSGCIVTDAQYDVNMFLQTATAVNVGDKVAVKGSKGTDAHALPYVVCDEVRVVSEGNNIDYPEAHDVTAEVDSYTSDSREWISASGVLSGNNVTIDGAVNSVSIIDASESLNLAALNGHKVTVYGYFDGVAAPALRIQAARIEDKGVVEVIYFSEDFEWLLPWAENSGAGQTVENDGSGTAPQIYSAKNDEGQTAAEALLAHGYGLEESRGASIYLQKCYLKFGKADYQAGLTLPAVDGIPSGEKVMLSFDWAPMVGGTRKFDPVQLIITVTNGSETVGLDPIGHNFVNEVDKLEWLHADVVLEGVSITKDTRITIKSDAWGETAATSGSSVYRRWFIDNIKLSRAN